MKKQVANVYLTGLSALVLTAVLFGGAVAQQGQGPQDIGVAASVINKVDGTVGQTTSAKKTGDRVFRNEVIKTGANSKGQILFKDETALTVGPDSEVTLDKFVFDPKGTSTVGVTASKGVFRFVSGSLPSQAYEIKTPAGTLGVRGTVGNLIVLADGTVVLQVFEGEFLYDGVVPPIVVKAGQVLILRRGQPPEVRDKLTNMQIALLLPIDQPDLKFSGLPDVPGFDKVKNLKDLIRGRGPKSYGYSD